MIAKAENPEVEDTETDAIEKAVQDLCKTSPRLKDEPQAFMRACIRMGFKDGVDSVHAKPLEWVEDNDDGWQAKSPIGEFNVYYDADYGWLCAIDGCADEWVKYPSNEEGFISAEAAKAHCYEYLNNLFQSMRADHE